MGKWKSATIEIKPFPGSVTTKRVKGGGIQIRVSAPTYRKVGITSRVVAHQLLHLADAADVEDTPE